MKKQLGKKRFVGKFAEPGVLIVIIRERKDDCDRFLDAFTQQAIEGNSCYFRDGGKGDRLEGVIELGKTCHGPEERLKKIISAGRFRTMWSGRWSMLS